MRPLALELGSDRPKFGMRLTSDQCAGSGSLVFELWSCQSRRRKMAQTSALCDAAARASKSTHGRRELAHSPVVTRKTVNTGLRSRTVDASLVKKSFVGMKRESWLSGSPTTHLNQNETEL